MPEDEIRVRIRDRYVWEYGDDSDGPPGDSTDNSDGSTDDSNDDTTNTTDVTGRAVDSEGTYDDEEPVYFGDTWAVVVEVINETGEQVPGTIVVTVDDERNVSSRMYLLPSTGSGGEWEHETYTLTGVGPIEKQSEDETERDVMVAAHLEDVSV